MKITHSILISFLFVLVLFAVTTYNDYKLSRAVDENVVYFSRSTEVIKSSSRFQRNVLSMVSGLRGYLLTSKGYFIESYDAANKDNRDILTELSRIITDSTQQTFLREIKTLYAKWTEDYNEPLKYAKSQAVSDAAKLTLFNSMYRNSVLAENENKIQTKLQERFKEFSTREYILRNQQSKKLISRVNKIKTVSYTLTIISFVTAITLVIFLIRKISGRMRQMTQLAESITQGNYNVSISVIGNDELSSLAKSLNHMATELSNTVFLLKRSNEELDQFAHVVSHDLKSPLRGISNVIGWIEEDHENELPIKVKEYLSLIKGRIQRTENLITGILSYARLNKSENIRELVDLNNLISEIIETTSEKNVHFEYRNLPIMTTERTLLYLVFSNLITNAIKYNNNNVKLVRIYYTSIESGFEFSIEDNGIGIPEIYHDRIFGIFQTLTDKDTFESTGVGLAIVKKILDTRGETIRIASKYESGSIFSFTWKNI